MFDLSSFYLRNYQQGGAVNDFSGYDRTSRSAITTNFGLNPQYVDASQTINTLNSSRNSLDLANQREVNNAVNREQIAKSKRDFFYNLNKDISKKSKGNTDKNTGLNSQYYWEDNAAISKEMQEISNRAFDLSMSGDDSGAMREYGRMNEIYNTKENNIAVRNSALLEELYGIQDNIVNSTGYDANETGIDTEAISLAIAKADKALKQDKYVDLADILSEEGSPFTMKNFVYNKSEAVDLEDQILDSYTNSEYRQALANGLKGVEGASELRNYLTDKTGDLNNSLTAEAYAKLAAKAAWTNGGLKTKLKNQDNISTIEEAETYFLNRLSTRGLSTDQINTVVDNSFVNIKDINGNDVSVSIKDLSDFATKQSLENQKQQGAIAEQELKNEGKNTTSTGNNSATSGTRFKDSEASLNDLDNDLKAAGFTGPKSTIRAIDKLLKNGEGLTLDQILQNPSDLGLRPIPKSSVVNSAGVKVNTADKISKNKIMKDLSKEEQSYAQIFLESEELQDKYFTEQWLPKLEEGLRVIDSEVSPDQFEPSVAKLLQTNPIEKVLYLIHHHGLEGAIEYLKTRGNITGNPTANEDVEKQFARIDKIKKDNPEITLPEIISSIEQDPTDKHLSTNPKSSALGKYQILFKGERDNIIGFINSLNSDPEPDGLLQDTEVIGISSGQQTTSPGAGNSFFN